MAKRGGLREFQAHLATRLAGASDQSAAGLLGIQAGSDLWLIEHVRPTLFRTPSGDACDAYNRHEADIALADGEAGRGLQVTVRFPQPA